MPQLQTALAALADIESRYEVEREQLSTERTGSVAANTELAATLESRYEAERAHCVQRLAELHHRIKAAMTYQDILEGA